LGTIDILVLVVAVAISVGIGLKLSGKNDSLEAYLLGGRQLPWWAILGSIVATETSTATVLSVPGDGYGTVGFRFLQLSIGYIVGRILVVLLLLPRYFDGKLMSAYEVLGNRFGRTINRFASIVFLISRNLGDGLRLFLAAMVLQQLMGWPLAYSAIAMGGLTMAYTFFGGMRSVVWNDCIQFVIYMAGGIAALFVITSQIPGGWTAFFQFASDNEKWKFLEWGSPAFDLGALGKFFADPYTIWAGVIGGSVLALGSHGTDQMMVQRYLSARNQSDAAKALLASGIVVFIQFAMFLFLGILLRCFFESQGALPEMKNDAIFAHFLVNYFPKNTGLIGLMLAAILSAAMSTLSSSLSSSASAVVTDLWLPNCAEPPSVSKQLLVSRGLTLAFGVLQIVIGIWAASFTESVVKNALTIVGFSSGVFLGLFGLALFTRRVQGREALLAALIGLTLMLLLQFGAGIRNAWISDPTQAWQFKLAFPWLPVLGSLSILLCGWGLSYLLPSAQRGRS
jgi:solute:Na+ symporter, SSS family